MAVHCQPHSSHLPPPLTCSSLFSAPRCRQMGNLHALLQFVSRASGIVSGRLADIFSPARMVRALRLLRLP